MEIPEIKISEIKNVEVPIVQQLQAPITATPINKSLPKPVVQLPSAELPSYQPIDVPTTEQWKLMMDAQNRQNKSEEEVQDAPRKIPDVKPITDAIRPVVDQPKPVIVPDQPKENLGVPVIEVPIVGEVPIPPKEQVILAGTTATASVAAAIAGKSVVEWMVGKMKPVIQQVYVQAKKRLHRDLTPYEIQIDFAAQLDLKKKVLKTFQKELKRQKQEQYLHWEQQQHQHISLHKEKMGENESQPSLLRRILKVGRVRNPNEPYQSPHSDV